jgi:hypothetical protein
MSTHECRALSYHIFVSAILLLSECQTDGVTDAEEYYEAVRSALCLLEEVQQWNAVANYAATILRDRLGNSDLVISTT